MKKKSEKIQKPGESETVGKIGKRKTPSTPSEELTQGNIHQDTLSSTKQLKVVSFSVELVKSKRRPLPTREAREPGQSTSRTVSFSQQVDLSVCLSFSYSLKTYLKKDSISKDGYISFRSFLLLA